MAGYAIFETALGWAALAWSPAGLTCVRLPEPTAERAHAALLRRFPDAVAADPPGAVAAVIRDVQRLLAGGRPDFAGAVLDLATTTTFDARVYAIARSIPVGGTLTYGEVAGQLGDRRLARQVGQALGRNPWPIIVPCHRVTAANGKLGGFSAPGGQRTKIRLLALEGAPAAAQTDLFG
jgi:methylated-DNA-[protein]-cysteine S-methyltransferase